MQVHVLLLSPGHVTGVGCVARLPELDTYALAQADDSAQPSPSQSGLPLLQVMLRLHQLLGVCMYSCHAMVKAVMRPWDPASQHGH